MDSEEEVKKELNRLLEYFKQTTYSAHDNDPEAQQIFHKCLTLLDHDYKYVTISNSRGKLSTYYPSQLVILEYEKAQSDPAESSKGFGIDTVYESINDTDKLSDLAGKARLARCRARFPVPVILYKGKHICRSATLSGGVELYGRYLFSRNDSKETRSPDEEIVVPQTQSDWQMFDRARSDDIRLLKTFDVGTIVDLMVENKKVKFLMNMTSSEKVDKENRYSDFTIVSLPYPGCEFFQRFLENNYEASELVFDWNQSYVDANLCVPNDLISSKVHVDWMQYKAWDIVKLTKNYLRLVLQYIADSTCGLLVHCISGWDRTPLFVSLLRLSLWADGAAHASLSPAQILYLTIAYDWMLFGHDLQDRRSKGEEIFFFCFYFLKYLASDEFSIALISKSKNAMHTDSDSHLERLLFEAEGHPSMKGSNSSLNSCSSSLSTKSQEVPTMYFFATHETDEQGNGHSHHQFTRLSGASPPLEPGIVTLANAKSTGGVGQVFHMTQLDSTNGNRTSPVAVPVPGKLRQRNESAGSTSIGSWQIISGTGSLRGSTSNSESGNTPNSLHLHQSHTSLYECPESTDSSATLVEDGLLSQKSGNGDASSRRMERLDAVRTLFYTVYAASVGLQMNEPSGFSSFLGNIVEKSTYGKRRHEKMSAQKVGKRAGESFVADINTMFTWNLIFKVPRSSKTLSPKDADNQSGYM